VQPVAAWEGLPPSLTWKERVCLLTYHSLAHVSQQEAPVTHLFEPGEYVREMRVPAGMLLTGAEHLLGHRLELIEGSVLMFAPEGKFEFDAYAFMDTKPGFHAVVYTVTDMVARSRHPNPDEARDVVALEGRWFGAAAPVIEQGRLLSERLKDLSWSVQSV
jgi:hypothetical protein